SRDERGSRGAVLRGPQLRCARRPAQHLGRCTRRGEAYRAGQAMNRAPFVVQERKRTGLLRRMFGRPHRENAVVEINNLLARADSVREVTRAEVEEICREHHTDLNGPLAGRFERLYRDYMTFCLADRHLSDDELADLAHLRTILRIPPETTAAIHEYVAR